MTGLPTMPPGWRPTTTIRPVPDAPGRGYSLTFRKRLWLFDPTGEAQFADIINDPTKQQWVTEPVFDGLNPCCP